MMQSEEPVLKISGVESTDICVKMQGIKANSCQENKYSSKVQILENSTYVLFVLTHTVISCFL